MAKARTLVGLDVHATKVVAAVLDVETGELAFFSLQAAGIGTYVDIDMGQVKVVFAAERENFPPWLLLAHERRARRPSCRRRPGPVAPTGCAANTNPGSPLTPAGPLASLVHLRGCSHE